MHDVGLGPGDEERAAQLHATSTIVDLVWWGPATYRSFTPAMDDELRDAYARHRDLAVLIDHAQRIPGRHAVLGLFPEYRELWDGSGVTGGHYGLQVAKPRPLLKGISHVDYLVDHLPWLHKALRASDFRAAKASGGHVLYIQCQPIMPISRDLGLIDLAQDGGLRALQLSYNVQDLVASGCTEGSQGGVSQFGAKVIAHLNELGVIVDASHCNQQTVLDACALSERPVMVSHTAADALYAHDRSISDTAAEAVASTGGVIGVVAVPFFLGRGTPTVSAMVDHIDHLVRAVGWEHVAIGTDWPMGAPTWVLEESAERGMGNGFRAEHGIRPTTNLVGFDDYRDFPNLTRALVARGYPDDQVRGILGENFLRVFEEVCG